MTLGRLFSLLLCSAAIGLGWIQPGRTDDRRSAYTQRKDSADLMVDGANSDAAHVEVNLSGTLSVKLHVVGATTLEVEKVEAIVASENWKEWGRGPAREIQNRDSKVWEQRFFLEPQRPGDIVLALVPMRYRSGPNEAWKTVDWDPIPVKVTTEITQADAKELRDIIPPEPASQPEPGFPWLIWSGLAFVAVALVLGIWQIGRRFKRMKPAVPPELWASNELDRIRAMHLAPDGIKHHALIAEVLRRYLDLRFELKTLEKTSTEFLDAIQQSGNLTSEQLTLLSHALDRCDLAKFAHVVPTPEECLALESSAETLIAQTARVRG